MAPSVSGQGRPGNNLVMIFTRQASIPNPSPDGPPTPEPAPPLPSPAEPSPAPTGPARP